MTKRTKQIIPFFAIALIALFSFGCKSDVDGKKQQKAFHVDANNNLLNKKGEIVKKAGEYKMEGGYYVDNNGDYIKRNIDKTKEKINEKVDNTKEKLQSAGSKTKEKLQNAGTKTKEKLQNAGAKTKEVLTLAKDRTTESVTANFNKLFNTKAIGTIYPLSEIKFNPKSHKITDFNKADVEGLAASLKDHPASRIQVQVYTADAKTKKDNRKISSDRAELVAGMLIALGVNKEQVSFKGMGLPVEDAKKAVENKVEVVVEK